MTKTIIKKYNIEEVRAKYSKTAWKVADTDLIRAYVNDDYDWYIENFLPENYLNADYDEKKKVANQFIEGIIAKEFVYEYLNNYYKENTNDKEPKEKECYPGTSYNTYSLKYTDNKLRFQHSTYSLERVAKKPTDFKLITTTHNTTQWKSKYETRRHKYVNCKWSKYDGLIPAMTFNQSRSTDTIILLSHVKKQIKLKLFGILMNYKSKGLSWEPADVTGVVYNTKVCEQLDVTDEYKKFLAKFKN